VGFEPTTYSYLHLFEKSVGGSAPETLPRCP
jgi:hypothetical protein